ncbi:MAG: hypothetical protein JO170_06510 [Verrucomicrobia bacterium]|nr:hypothetical protein [Verrucomicrobiota bacterium]
MDALIDSGISGNWVAAEVMYMYASNTPERLEDLRSQIRRLIANFNVTEIDDRQPGTLDAYAFVRIATWLIDHGSKDEDAALAAVHLSEQAISLCIDRSQNYVDSNIMEELLPEVLAHCGDVAWPVLSNGITKHRDRIWTFEHLFGSPYAEGKAVAGSIFMVEWDLLRAWAHQNPDFGPAFLMRIAPVFDAVSTPAKGSIRSWSRIVLHLLDEFGDRRDVLSALSNNMLTFCSWGSRVPLHQQYKDSLLGLVTHHRPSVAAWARRQLESQEQIIRSERSRDDEQKFGIF